MAPQTRANGANAQRQEASKKQKVEHHSEPKTSKQNEEQTPHRTPPVAASATIASTPAVSLAKLLVSAQTPAVKSGPDVVTRASEVAKVKLALSGQKYFPDVPVKVRDMVSNVANECLILEHSARHPFQHKMLEVVDTAVDSAKARLEDELRERKVFVETAQQKKETLIRVQSEKQKELDNKQAELANSIEERGSAAERLKAAQEAAALARTATLTAKLARDACSQGCMKIKKAYESFTSLDDEGVEKQKRADVVATLVPTLKILGVDGATLDALPSVMMKPAGERSSGESMSLIVVEGTFAKRLRNDSALLNKSEEDLKQQETAEATAKENVQKRTDELTACGEAVKTKEAEKKEHEQQVSAAASEVKKHEAEMSSGESKLKSQQADVDAFSDIQTKYLLLKNPPPPPVPEPGQASQTAPAAVA